MSMPSVDAAASETEQTANARRRCSRALAKLATVVGSEKPQSAAALARAQAIIDILAALTDDDDILGGACCCRCWKPACSTPEQAPPRSARQPNRIATELQRLGSLNIGVPRCDDDGRGAPSCPATRPKACARCCSRSSPIRGWCSIKLAAQLQQLRDSKDAPQAERERLAYETREVYAPLANRLGVWQLKWELEDLSFRYLDPENYKRVAGWLAAKRADRERYIERSHRAAAPGAGARPTSRPKSPAGRSTSTASGAKCSARISRSISSTTSARCACWSTSVADCYAALGIVHGLWPYIPGEFDDYIATPKDNLYRSLHTAVIGPGKLPLEIQIRTREMHDHAELGVAAHWRYKEGGKANPAYEQKIVWLRQILEPGERGEETEGEFLDRVRSEIFEDRVYAISPRGEVVDLPRGATPLDFAYHVHTDLGHRCRGAKVNGRMVPLNQHARERRSGRNHHRQATQSEPRLAGAVARLSGLAAQPQQGALLVPQARRATEPAAGQADPGARAAAPGDSLGDAAGADRRVQSRQCRTVVSRDRRRRDQRRADQRRHPASRQAAGAAHARSCVGPQPRRRRRRASRSMASTICCRISPAAAARCRRKRSVGTSHSAAASASIARTAPTSNAWRRRAPSASFRSNGAPVRDRSFPVDIHVRAYDRRGLLRDITAVLADSKINIHAMNTVTQRVGRHCRHELQDHRP